MSLPLIAFPRRQGVFLAAVLGEERRPGAPALLSLVAEDGARFTFPADRAIVRVAWPPGEGGDAEERGGEDDEPVARLQRLRARLTPFDGWFALHGELEDGAELDLTELAEAADLAGAEGLLCLALGASGAAPWFRQRGATFAVVPATEALRDLFERHRAVSQAEGGAALRDWWPDRAAGPPEGFACAAAAGLQETVLGKLEETRWFEPGYEPDRAVALSTALRALAHFALAGELAADARGRDLARRLGLPDEPDQVLEELVACGVLPHDVNPAPHRGGLAAGFPSEALAEFRQLLLLPPNTGPREDLTGLCAVAVDDPDTREVDDAVSIRSAGDGWELLVHIADVAVALPHRGPLDAAARDRGSSLYAPEGGTLMLPPEFVLGRLALSTQQARDAVTGIFTIAAGGAVSAARFVRSRVRLARRLSYAQTAEPGALAADSEAGADLVRLAESLRTARRERGARILRLPSLKVSVSAGRPELALRRQDAPGDVVVTEAMVLFNAQAAALLAEHDAPAVYRAQAADGPAVREPPPLDDPLYALRIRRSFPPTETLDSPAPHTGIGVGAYAQVTSPIRRYGDLVNQRQFVALLAGARLPYSRADVQELIGHLSQRERAVRAAGHDRVRYWTAIAIQERAAHTIGGLLSRAPRRGQGAVWVPELCRELPLRAPPGWRPPPEGTAQAWRVLRVLPWRGRIELAPADAPAL